MSGSGRNALVLAMIEIIAEHGFEGLSVRQVARRGGLSIGAVQHHFPTKSAMLDAAMTAIATMAAGRSSELDSVSDPKERLHLLVDFLIPEDATNQVARVWLAFATRAVVDTRIRTAYMKLWAHLRSELRLLIAAASGRPEEAEQAARELLALLDGLALSIVAEHQDSGTARLIAHARTDSLIHEGS